MMRRWVYTPGGLQTPEEAANTPEGIMSLEFECIITGCALVIEPGEHYWGDAHRHGEIIVFNAVFSGEKMEPHVNEGHPDPLHPIIIVDIDCEPFHRRGVFVMPSYGVTFNPAAMRRMNE